MAGTFWEANIKRFRDSPFAFAQKIRDTTRSSLDYALP